MSRFYRPVAKKLYKKELTEGSLERLRISFLAVSEDMDWHGIYPLPPLKRVYPWMVKGDPISLNTPWAMGLKY